MIVVADSSPFVVLVATGLIQILPDLFGENLIPPEVATELAAPRRPESVRAFIASPPSWLRIQAHTTVAPIPGLDPGETSAILLAEDVRAGRLIIDESRGRKAASARGVLVVGTVCVLEIAARLGLIDLADAFVRIKQTDFWISHKFLDERLRLFAQRASNGTRPEAGA